MVSGLGEGNVKVAFCGVEILMNPPTPRCSYRSTARGSGARMPLFVKKSDDEGIDFYYLGELTPLADSFQEDRMASKGGKPGPKVVRMDMRLSDPVPADLYHYLQDSL
jgi:hypothetical protein